MRGLVILNFNSSSDSKSSMLRAFYYCFTVQPSVNSLACKSNKHVFLSMGTKGVTMVHLMHVNQLNLDNWILWLCPFYFSRKIIQRLWFCLAQSQKKQRQRLRQARNHNLGNALKFIYLSTSILCHSCSQHNLRQMPSVCPS